MKHQTKILSLLLAFALVLSTTACTTTPATDPGTGAEKPAAADWKPYDENGQIKRTDRDGNGENGVVSTGKYEASLIGAQIISEGGNAIDAAVAVGFALGVCEPQSSGLGGGGFMIIHSAKTGETKFIDFREMAPAAATPDMWPMDENGDLTDDSKWVGGKAVGVPGEVKGLLYALDTYGTMTRAQVMDPSIALAQNGYEVSAVMNRDMKNSFEKLVRFPATAEIYLKDGFPYEVGDIITNPDLAKTLTTIRDNGESAFYTGPIAEAIVQAAQDAGGRLTMEDMASFEIREREPSVGTYRGYEIVSAPPPSSGGTTIVEILNIMENYDVGAMDINSAEYYHLLSESFKLAFADRAEYMGDTAFIDVPLAGMTSKEYAKELSDLILPNVSTDHIPGNPWIYESPQTTHFSIMDKEGNIVAVTKTVNTVFSSGVVAKGTGVLLNNQMDDFDHGYDSVNAIAGGKIPLSSMSPTIIMKDGKPVMSLGAPGAQRIITGVVQVITKVIDHNMDIQDAISAPRIHDGSDYDAGTNVMVYESRIPEETVKELEAMGHKMIDEGDWLEYPCVQGVVMLEDGTLRGGADPRRDGKAVGY